MEEPIEEAPEVAAIPLEPKIPEVLRETRLFVGGLTPEMTADVLGDRFKPFGEVRGVHIVPAKFYDGVTPPDPNRCRGFAYVTLMPKDIPSLKRCLSLYNGSKWRGCVLKVQIARLDFKERIEKEEADDIAAAEVAQKEAEEFRDPAGPHGRREDALRHVVDKALTLFPLLARVSEPYRRPLGPGEMDEFSSDSEPEAPEPEPVKPARKAPVTRSAAPALAAAVPSSPVAKPIARRSPPRTPKAAVAPPKEARDNDGAEGAEEEEEPAVDRPLELTAPVSFANPWASLYPGSKPAVVAVAPKPAATKVAAPQQPAAAADEMGEGEAEEEGSEWKVELKTAQFSNPWASVFGGASAVAAKPQPKEKATKETKKPAATAAPKSAAKPGLPSDYVGVTVDDEMEVDEGGPQRSESFDYEAAARGGRVVRGEEEEDEVERALMEGPGPDGEEAEGDVNALLALMASRAVSGGQAGPRDPKGEGESTPRKKKEKKAPAAAVDKAEGPPKKKTKKQLKEEERKLKKKLTKEGKGEAAIRDAIALFRAAHKPGATPALGATPVKVPAARDPNVLPKSRPKAEAREALKTVDFMETGERAAIAARATKRKALDPEDLSKFASDSDGEAEPAAAGVAAAEGGEDLSKGGPARKRHRHAAEAPKGAELKSSVSIFLRHLGKSSRNEDDAMLYDQKKYQRGGDKGKEKEKEKEEGAAKASGPSNFGSGTLPQTGQHVLWNSKSSGASEWAKSRAAAAPASPAVARGGGGGGDRAAPKAQPAAAAATEAPKVPAPRANQHMKF